MLGFPKPANELPPGVVIIDEGSARLLCGGVEGGRMLDDRGRAGEGDVARYRSKSAPSSPDLPFFSLL